MLGSVSRAAERTAASVGAGARLERKLVQLSGSVEHRCVGTREGFGGEATQRVAGGDAAHTSPPRFGQGC